MNKMNKNKILLLTGGQILSLLKSKENDILKIIKQAYTIHSRNDSSLPYSHFLRFPADDNNRIIALPAYLGGDFKIAGIKWISSFPKNILENKERASAILVLNSVTTGHPMAVLESSVISAKRTAASAALASYYIGQNEKYNKIGIIGCGLINSEILRFILAIRPEIEVAYLFDLKKERTDQFELHCKNKFNNLHTISCNSSTEVFKNSKLISFATTAKTPYINSISDFEANSTILNISLRDLSSDIILSSDNIVDDINHIFKENTSIHLAEQKVNHKKFVRCSISDIIDGETEPKLKDKISIFSPFGLGVLDLALGSYIYDLAINSNIGIIIEDFLPPVWTLRD